MTWFLAEVVEFALIAWLGILALFVALSILRGDIPLAGLLSSRSGGADPERVQSLLIVGFVLVAYLVEFADLPSDATALPDVPEALLALLAGSNGLYLSGKIARTGALTPTPPAARNRRREGNE